MKTTICIIALIALSSAVNLRMESEKSLSKLVLPNKEELFNYFPMLAQMTGPLEGVYDFINGLEDNLRNE
jgi:hypothetical protein